MNDNRNYEIKVTCIHCKREFTVKVRVEDYIKFDMPNRPMIQDIFPYLTAGERELLLTQTCQECWDNMFKFLEDEEDDCYAE